VTGSTITSASFFNQLFFNDTRVIGYHSLAILFFLNSIASGYIDSDVAMQQDRKPVDGIRIAWDFSTRKQLSPLEANYAGYARMIRLHNGKLFCVYESDGSVYAIKSDERRQQWSAPVLIAAKQNDIARAVPEVLQLHDQSILVSYNLRPRGNNTDSTKRFAIEMKRTNDDGIHWTDAVEVYRAGHEFKNGCWEPAQIQLPSGEIQLYVANEGPYTKSNEQEITLFRSMDNGATWTKGEQVSFRSGYRDGMPVPVLLQNKREVIFAIEDNGIDGKEFKPAIIRSSSKWKNAPVLAASPDREYAMDNDAQIPANKYAGAPYIRQLPSGEIILSYQSNEYRKDFQWDRSDMVVAIGSPEGRNFNRKSIPFYTADSTQTTLWNSLCVENDSTVIALGSTNIYGKTAAWMIKGYILHGIKSHQTTLTPDGESKEPLWRTEAPVFIGGYGPTQAKIRTGWNMDKLFFAVQVKDKDIVTAPNDLQKGDGVRLLLDVGNLSAVKSGEGVYVMLVTSAGKAFFQQRANDQWTTWSPNGFAVKSKKLADGYQVEVSIPWRTLSASPLKNKRIGFHAEVNESSNGMHCYTEPLSGNVAEQPFTWLPLVLTD
jgi:hypothetical protein